MLKFNILFVLLILAVNLFAQQQPVNEKYFDPQPQNFLKQLEVLVKENQRDELVEFFKNLEKEIKGGKITENQLSRMVEILNIMHTRRMTIWPYYRDFMIAATNATKSGYDEKFLDRWYLFNKGILETTKKGDNRSFTTFIDFSNDLFVHNALVADKSKHYVIESKDLSFKFNGGKILVEVPQTTLRGYFQTDTTYIFNTSGTYNVMDKLWTSNGGKVTWQRIGTPEDQLYATFGNYKIDMTKSEYRVDSALLYYPEYFPSKVYGQLRDRITKEKDFTTVMYPQFEAYSKKFFFDNKVAPNVKLSGGFTMKGNDVVIGSDDDAPANVQIYDKTNTKKLFAAEGFNCLFKRGSHLKMNQARVRLYAGNDSIIHPYSDVKYDVNANEITVLKEEVGSGKARFRSGYHKMSFDAEMLKWKLDDDFIDIKMLVGKGQNAAKFISDNNFDQETYNVARTAAVDKNPLSIVLGLTSGGNETFSLDQFVAAFGPSFSVATVMPELFALERDGFVNYNATDRRVRVNRELTDFYLKANAKKVDYDLLRFKSYGEKSVAKFYTNNKRIAVNRVKRIPFNDSTYVYGYPVDTSVVEVNDLRKIKFSGKLMAGRLDLFGSNFGFHYDSFAIKSGNIDKVRIYVPDKVDETTGEVKTLKGLTSQIEKVDGQIYINGRFNKSGRESALHYPKLTTYKNSYIYYDHPNIYNGRYKRDGFYFEVFPFRKDSLNEFEPDALYYDGKLFSSGIFDPFEETVRIQKNDLSLGFTTITKGKVRNYGTKGGFDGTLSLSNNGLIGKGDISFQSTKLTSDSILYFPEYTTFMAKEVEMDQQKVGAEFPQMSADSVFVAWKPLADTMLLRSSKGNAMDMYSNSTKMNGLLILEPTGLSGRGFLDFPEAKITSMNMRFKADIMNADTSSMEIKSLGNKITFKTPNVKTRMDFVQKIGDFKSNDKDISTDFAYNQYRANINEFRWDMNKKILTFKPQEGSRGMRFTSVHPTQDSLFFYTKSAEYNLVTSVIKTEGVEEIIIADSKVIPDNGKVNIFPEAKIETLKNASIEGDTNNMWHTIEKASLDINGKNDMIGHGIYNLKIQEKDYPIKLNSIRTLKIESDRTKRSKGDPIKYTIEGTGKVERSENLKIYRNVDYHGEVQVRMNRKLPHFKGKQRIEFRNPPFKSTWFGVDNEINVSELEMYKRELLNEADNHIYTGFMVDRINHRGIYTVILNTSRGPDDDIAFDARGLIKHNVITNNYLFGDTAKILSGYMKGNKIEYNDSLGTLVADGKLNPCLRMSGIPVNMGGITQNDLSDSTYKFMGSLGMNIGLDNRVMVPITNFILENFALNKDIQYNKKETKKSFAELFHEKDLMQMYKEIETGLTLVNSPKYSPFNFVFSDLIMEYDAIDMTWRAKPEFGLVLAGNRPVNKMSFGYLELGYGESFDNFSLYMQAKSKEWIYMSYAEGIFSLSTSDDAVNNALNMIEPRKRIIRKSEKEYYTYTSAGQMEIDAFKKRMARGGKFTDEERRITGEKQEEVKGVGDAPIEDAKTAELKALEAEEAKKDSLEDAELKAIEKEIEELEKLEEAKKKANADKKAELEEAEEDKSAPDPSPAPASMPKNEEKPEVPSEEKKSDEVVPAEGDKKVDDEAPSNRGDADEKKEPAPPKKTEGQSLFDSYF